MRDVNFYLDAARKNTGAKSDRDLGKMLALTNSAISHWRTKRCWPEDEQMMQLATMAGIPQGEALLELSMWRTSGPAQNVYKALMQKLQVTAIAVLIAVFLVPSMAQASPPPSPEGAYTLYYGKCRNLLLSVFRYLSASVSRLKGKFRHVFEFIAGAAAPARKCFALAA